MVLPITQAKKETNYKTAYFRQIGFLNLNVATIVISQRYRCVTTGKFGLQVIVDSVPRNRRQSKGFL